MDKIIEKITIDGNTISLDDNNIIYLVITGEINEKKQIEINNACQELMNKVEGTINAIIDLNNAEKTSTKARKKQKEISEYKKVEKVALFGIHHVARVIASFFMKISNNKNIRFFKTKEEALDWINN